MVDFGFQIPMEWVVHNSTKYFAVVCAFITFVVIGREMARHIKSYKYPDIQRHVLRIFMFAPIYAVDSCVALWMPEVSLYINTIRDCYEAFVLYQFLSLLIRYGGGETALVRSLNSKQYKGKHLWPLCCYYFKLDRHFLVTCKRGVLQYCFFKIVTALIACLLHPWGYYEEGDMTWFSNSYPWFFVINNISITISLYYLVLFDVELHSDLQKYRPLLKFAAIKLVIFFAFWQGASLVMLDRMGLLEHVKDEHENREIGVSLQDLLICVELVPIAFLITYAYGRKQLQKEVDDIRVFEEKQGKEGLGTITPIAMEAKHEDPMAQKATNAINLVDCVEDAVVTFRPQKADVGLLEEGEGVEQTEEKIHIDVHSPHQLRDTQPAGLVTNESMIMRDDDGDDEHQLVDPKKKVGAHEIKAVEFDT
eukprot:PhF_6_TR21032/c0_g1_i1/m.30252